MRCKVWRQILISFIVVLTAAPGLAEDYWVRLEIHGYDIEEPIDVEPENELLETYETLIRESVPFRIRIQQGKRTVLFEGEFNKNEKGELIGPLRFSDLLDTGIRVPAGEGKVTPVENVRSSSTTVSVNPGVPLHIGSIETRSHETHSDGTRHFHNSSRTLILKISTLNPHP